MHKTRGEHFHYNHDHDDLKVTNIQQPDLSKERNQRRLWYNEWDDHGQESVICKGC